MKRVSHFIGVFIALTCLYGCTTPGTISDSASQSDNYTPESINQLLTKAQSSLSPLREQLLIEVARQLQTIDELSRAEKLLTSIDTALLSGEYFVNYTLVFSAIALENDAYFLAKRILTSPRLEQQWSNLKPVDQITLRQRRADLFILLGEPEISIQERLQLLSLLNDQDSRHYNQDLLWQTLMSLPLRELRSNTQSNEQDELSGWYNLALLSKDNQSNLEKQQSLINQWMARWPAHPASMRLPNDLQLLQQLIKDLPQQVAILLPEQGKLAKAGQAVRDGFIAAHYQAMAVGVKTPVLRFYDSSQNFLSQYQQAINDGAQMIVGPLAKDNVALLASQVALVVPTLAVNYDEEHQEPAQNLYQFGLSAEDESRQVAERAWLEGHRYAMILSSQSSWGTRSAEAFRQTWQELGGSVINQSLYTGKGDYSTVIKTALQIDSSQQRARAVQNLLGENMEYEPRRRRDIDMIFLAAKPSQARQIKPTLAFHYAGKVPVYATSHIYSGQQDAKSDSDLNGIKFSTLPWFFDSNSAEKKEINSAVNPAPSYQRLYALGVDSFQIYPRIKQLELISQTRLYGVTGVISLNQQRQIEREQVWARISAGKAKKLEALEYN